MAIICLIAFDSLITIWQQVCIKDAHSNSHIAMHVYVYGYVYHTDIGGGRWLNQVGQKPMENSEIGWGYSSIASSFLLPMTIHTKEWSNYDCMSFQTQASKHQHYKMYKATTTILIIRYVSCFFFYLFIYWLTITQ